MLKPAHSLEWMGRVFIGQYWHLHPLLELVRIAIVFYITLNHDITLFRSIIMFNGTTPHNQEYSTYYDQNIVMDLSNVMEHWVKHPL